MLTPCNYDATRRAIKRAAHLAARASLALAFLFVASRVVSADQLRLTDGTTIEVDEAWEDAQGVWYRRGGVTHMIERARVRSIEREPRAEKADAVKPAARIIGVEKDSVATPAQQQPVWIYLVGGARVEADEVSETAEGVWYKHANIMMFIERARIERIEREPVVVGEKTSEPAKRAWRERGWSTGSARIDSLIRLNGARYGVDPFLIFCVMEQESHFNTRAVSPVGARGLMQLMPGTAARFGVRRPHDPSQSIMGGSRYLKELLRRFGGRVDLVLAGYNAGEGAVMKYGHRVPPYRETRNYVRRISARYRRGL